MKNKLIGLIAMGAIIMMAGTAWAYDIDDHVVLGTDHRGDVLIVPGGVASQGWYTQLKVINTSNSESVVAKVVIRSKVYSQELLDFMIYLSPSDVWVGDVKLIDWEGQMVPGVYSADDSCLTLEQPPVPPVWASEANPFICPLDPGAFGIYYSTSRFCEGIDLKEMFYVVITQAWCTPRDRMGPIPKQDIKTAYDLAAFPRFVAPECIDYLTEMAPNPYMFAQPPVCPPPDSGTVEEPIWGDMTRCNTLTGVFNLVNIGGSNWGANNMTALKNMHTARPLWVGEETILGYDTYNTLGEVEAVLAKRMVADYLRFDEVGSGQTLHSFLAPTWLPRTNGQGISVAPDCNTLSQKRWPMGPFFRNAIGGDCFCNSDGIGLCGDVYTGRRQSISVWQTAWDLSEGPALVVSPPPEKGLLLLTSELTNVVPSGPFWLGDIGFAAGVIPYTEGWVNYSFISNLGEALVTTDCVPYAQWLDQEPSCRMIDPLLSIVGVPVIASVLEFQATGGVAVYNGAYQAGEVYYDGVEYPNYPLTQGGPNPIVP